MSESAAHWLTELYDFREALETHAVLKLSENKSDKDCDRMHIANEELAAVIGQGRKHGWSLERSTRWLVADAKFHVALLFGASNASLLQLIEKTALMPSLFGWRPEFVPEAAHERIYQDHRDVIWAIADGRANDACQIVSRHLRRGLEIALGCLADYKGAV